MNSILHRLGGVSRLTAAAVTIVLASPLTAWAVPITTAPAGDLTGDDRVTSADLQCLVLTHELWTLQEPVTGDACAVDGDCPEGVCQRAHAGFKICVPDCLSETVTIGEDPAVTCANDAEVSATCLGTTQRRNADLNCDDDISNVDFQFMIQLLLGQISGPNSPDVDGDGRLNFCDRDSDGDGDPDANDCQDLDPTRSHLAPEKCNGIDDTCDLLVDRDDPSLTTDDVVPCENSIGV